jgi:hypothetical protein
VDPDLFFPTTAVEAWDENNRMDSADVISAGWKLLDRQHGEEFVMRLQNVDLIDYIDIRATKGGESAETFGPDDHGEDEV